MPLFTASERSFVKPVSELFNANPFLPEWIELERRALGPAFKDTPRPLYRLHPQNRDDLHPNSIFIGERAHELATETVGRLAQGVSPSDSDWQLYDALILLHLYFKHADAFFGALDAGAEHGGAARLRALWENFCTDFTRFFTKVGRGVHSYGEASHVFAWFFQVRRAYFHIYRFIFGRSKPVSKLRGAVWQSIFTCDMQRWGRTLFNRLGDVPTLITGPSGTGKELAARAIGLSRYIPFDAKKKAFASDHQTGFHALNLSALAPTLIESELFGHVAGSFTGATRDREGWLQTCDEYGAVFLDEVGELEAGLQVKLLRVLQTREFQRLGDTDTKCFPGKIIAATNRDLAAEMQAGRFREDFYYRLCADRLTTPSLSEQFADEPEDLRNLVAFIAQQIVGESESDILTTEVVQWIENNLGPRYPWPGNYRELEQCVRSFVLRRDYTPAGRPDNPGLALANAVLTGSLSADELERRYFTLVFSQAGSYQEAGRRLGRDWRTLREKIDTDLLANLTAGQQAQHTSR